jgi:hypothetical protein
MLVFNCFAKICSKVSQARKAELSRADAVVCEDLLLSDASAGIHTAWVQPQPRHFPSTGPAATCSWPGAIAGIHCYKRLGQTSF